MNIIFNVFSLTPFLLDDMGNRIDDLERNIADLVTQTGVEGPPK